MFTCFLLLEDLDSGVWIKESVWYVEQELGVKPLGWLELKANDRRCCTSERGSE